MSQSRLLKPQFLPPAFPDLEKDELLDKTGYLYYNTLLTGNFKICFVCLFLILFPFH